MEQICGVPQDTFRRVCELMTENSGRDHTTAVVYSVGWTRHTAGVQYIRTAAVLQSLLGNIGRPGGGILALRGHASIQGSTDIRAAPGARGGPAAGVAALCGLTGRLPKIGAAATAGSALLARRWRPTQPR